MSVIEGICKKVSSSIAQELDLDKDRESVVNYGMFAFIQICISVGLVVIFGAFFRVVIEALITSFTGSILRKSSGGVHATSPEKCALIGVVVCVGAGVISKNANISLNLMVAMGLTIFLWSYIIILKYAPVDSPSKPINNKEKRKRLKSISIVILTIYLIIITLNIMLYSFSGNAYLIRYSLCMYLAIVWQVFSLTKSAHNLLGRN